MCGICGKFYYQSDNYIDRQVLMKMTRSLYSRGPDDEGFFIKRNIGLGVRRLSVVDIKNGHQPMCNEDRTVWVVFNGEIYNYPELKKILLQKGHLFFTNCDSEVIAHLYEEFGVLFMQKLQGMFALALFDVTKNQLLLARDRFGIKPLYFSSLKDSVVFSSSVNSLIQDDGIPLDLNYKGIHCYFSYNYFPDAHSPFKNINKLLPGSYLMCGPGGVEIRHYWQLNYKDKVVKNEIDYVEEFLSIFNKAVDKQLFADIPVGVFLSGGLDSSGLAYFARKFENDLDTFTLGFKDETYDERPYAAAVSSHLDTRHHEITITENIVSLLKRTALALDIPMGEPSFLATFKLAEFAKGYSGVILSGEGADELFGGYETYKADILANIFMDFPPIFRQRLLPSLIGSLPLAYGRLNFKQKAGLFLNGINGNNIPHYSWRDIFSEEEKRMLYSEYFFNQLLSMGCFGEPYEIFVKYFYGINSKNYLERAMYFDTKVWLSDSVLHRVDMASMSHALEVRVPYLDEDLVKFAYRLPINKKINKMKGKYLLKIAFRDKLPAVILGRPKHGFSVPISKWLKHELKEFVFDLLSNISGEIGLILNRDYVLSLLNEHIKGHRDHGRKLWNIIIFVLWFNALSNRKRKVIF